MLIISDIAELEEALKIHRREFKHLSLVPTMGNLHEGHLKLVNQASEISDFVCVSTVSYTHLTLPTIYSV